MEQGPKECAQFPRNPNKAKICDVRVRGSSYSVYEYDLRDACFIDHLTRDGISETHLIIAMLRLAMPDIPDDELLTLTQSQAATLLTQIQISKLPQVRDLSSSLH